MRLLGSLVTCVQAGPKGLLWRLWSSFRRACIQAKAAALPDQTLSNASVNSKRDSLQPCMGSDSVYMHCAVLAVPFVLHLALGGRRIRHAHLLLLQAALLLCAVAFANLIYSRTGDARNTAAHAMLAAMGVLTAVLLPLLLEHALSISPRIRHSCGAGLSWMLSYALTLVAAGVTEGLRCNRGAATAWRAEVVADGVASEQAVEDVEAARACTTSRVKWLVVAMAGAAFVAGIAMLVLSARRAPQSARVWCRLWPSP